MSDLIHMGGLVSGTDVQGIIDKLLAIKTTRIDAVQEQKVTLEANVAAWLDVKSYMTTLSDAAYDLRSIDTWSAMTTTSSDSTKMTATASSTAAETSYSITIDHRATAHSVASDQFDASTNLVGTVLTAGDTFTITGDPAGDPQTITIDDTNETLTTLASKINEAASSMDETDRVYAQIIDDQLVITRSKTGATDIQLENTSGTPLAALGIGTTAAYDHEWVASQDASFTINGSGAITRSSNTNITDVIGGVSLNLLADSGTATLTVAPDTEKVKTVITDFLTAYNQAVAKVAEYTAVDMTDPLNPVTGQLQNETLARYIPDNLRKLATALKSSMTSENAAYTYKGSTGVLNSLQGLGIWTESTTNTLAVTDEDRLDFMLANYFETVEQLFMGVAGSDEDGIGKDVYNYAYKVSTDLTGDIDLKLVSLSNQVLDKTETIEKMFDDMDAYETRLWNDFTVMEDAISSMQQDLSWLVSEMDAE